MAHYPLDEPAQEHVRNALQILMNTGFMTPASTYICFELPDIDAAKERLKEAIRLLERPHGQA